jgi:hypothetical protein
MGEHTMPTKMEVSYSLSVAQLSFDQQLPEYLLPNDEVRLPPYSVKLR